MNVYSTAQSNYYTPYVFPAVTAGTITQAQADAITAKETEMKTFMDIS